MATQLVHPTHTLYYICPFQMYTIMPTYPHLLTTYSHHTITNHTFTNQINIHISHKQTTLPHSINSHIPYIKLSNIKFQYSNNETTNSHNT